MFLACFFLLLYSLLLIWTILAMLYKHWPVDWVSTWYEDSFTYMSVKFTWCNPVVYYWRRGTLDAPGHWHYYETEQPTNLFLNTRLINLY